MTPPETRDAMTPPDAQLIRALLGPQGPRLELLAEVDSTNTWLLERAFANDPANPLLVVATVQRAGRGRRGRTWIAEPGRSIALSLAFERAHVAPPSPGLSLAIGCALAQTFAPYCDGLSLKWPNDLLRHGRKAGGILIETRVARTGSQGLLRVVVGLGLNVRTPLDPLALIDQPAGGLFDDGAPGLGREQVVALAAGAIVSAASLHASDGLAPFIDIWERFDAWRDQQVVLTEAGQPIAQGRALGIDDSGALRLLTADGERTVIAGDLSLRTAPQATP